MIKRINQYLLTHYPLVWNTRLVWMLTANFILHLLFFTGGLLSITAVTLKNFYRLERVGGEDIYILSVLCGLVMLIVWCVFYLRNNAFKNFYRIGKGYLAKEFAFMFIILLTSASYFISYQWGVRVKVRSITGEKALKQEMDIINTAMIYLPITEAPYFILNNCAEKEKRAFETTYDTEITTFDTSYTYRVDTLHVLDSSEYKSWKRNEKMKAAMRRPDAFSYWNYCNKALTWEEDSHTTAVDYSNKNRRWLLGRQKDSVRVALTAFYRVLDKYNIHYRLNTDSIIRQVFSDSVFSIGTTLATTESSNINGYEVPNAFYFDGYRLNELYNVIKDGQLTADNSREQLLLLTIAAYTALCIAILLLCYRRFSRSVFLISVIGTFIWAILIGLLVAGSHSEDFFMGLMLFLTLLFLVVGLASMNGTSKRLAGVSLNWHVFLAPFFVMLIVGVIENYNRHIVNGPYLGNYYGWMEKNYPISTWVSHHITVIIQVNFFASFTYVACLFNKWAKRWQAMPEE